MSGYWAERRHLRYYRQVLAYARQYVPGGGAILDVGGRDCEYILWFDWFRRRQVIDLQPPPALPGVTALTGDFMAWQPVRRYDLVLCLQVLEHLAAPAPFARKLLQSGRFVIVSVPYRWPAGRCIYHPQDPVDGAKLARWTGRPWLEKAIVAENGVRRLVAVFRGSGAGPDADGRTQSSRG